MSRYDQDQDLYDCDDDKRFYEKTAYNEEYYIEREQSRSGSRTSISSLERASPSPKRNRRLISRRVEFFSDDRLKSSSA